MAFYRNLVLPIFLSCVLALCSIPAEAQDWTEYWNDELWKCFYPEYDSTAYANSKIVPALQNASNNGDRDAKLHLLFWQLMGRSKPSGEIFKELQVLADKDNFPAASCSLGESYLEGFLVVRLPERTKYCDDDYILTEKSKGLPYLQKAVEGGFPLAAEELFKIYLGIDYEGLVEPDFDKAYYYAHLGAEQGSSAMQYYLARTFYEANENYPNTYVDETHFRYWMRQSAENGFPDAQFYVGMLLADTSQNALYWLKKAATFGHETAIINVAKKYNDLGQYDKAIQWCDEYLAYYPHLFKLKKVKYYSIVMAGASIDEILYYLEELSNDIFTNSEGIEVEDIYFVAWQIFSIAEEESNRRAQYKLQETAFKLLTLSADRGHAESLYSLGLCYDLGKGTRENRTKAHDCYIAAARKGSEKAQQSCKRLNLTY